MAASSTPCRSSRTASPSAPPIPDYCPARGRSRRRPPDPPDARVTSVPTNRTPAPRRPISCPRTRPRSAHRSTVTVTVQHPVVGPTGSVELSGVPDGPLTDPLDAGVGDVLGVRPRGRRPHPHRDLRPGRGARGQHRRPPAARSSSSRARTTLAVTPSGGTSPAGDPVTLTATVAQRDEHRGRRPDRRASTSTPGRPLLATATLSGDTATASDVALDGGLHSLTAVYLGDDGFETSTSAGGRPCRPVVDHHRGHRARRGGLRRGVPAERDGLGQRGRRARRHRHRPVQRPDHRRIADLHRRLRHPGRRRRQHDGLHDPARRGVRASGSPTPATTTTRPASPPSIPSRSTRPGPPPTSTVPSSGTVSGEPATFTATVDGARPRRRRPPVRSTSPSTARSPPRSRSPPAWRSGRPTDLTVGFLPHVVVATYDPDDANFDDSESGAVAHYVSKGSTTTALTAPATSVAGESVTLEATVSPVAPSTADPVGSVTFRSGATMIGHGDAERRRRQPRGERPADRCDLAHRDVRGDLRARRQHLELGLATPSAAPPPTSRSPRPSRRRSTATASRSRPRSPSSRPAVRRAHR